MTEPLLRPIAVADLPQHWPWVRQGLEELIARFDCDWLPEDVYAAIKAGAAGLSIIGDKAGFIVLQQQQRVRGPCLFVWVIVGDLAPYEQQLYAELEKVAREIKAPTIEMWSPRTGWGRRGFFKEHSIVYVHEVEPSVDLV